MMKATLLSLEVQQCKVLRHFNFIFLVSSVILFVFFNTPLGAQNFEVRFLINVNHSGNKNFTNVMKGFSCSMTPVSLATPLAILYDERGSMHFRHSWNAIGALALTGAVTQLMKISFKRPRPFVTHAEIEKRTEGGGYSFPSGHTSMAFCTATILTKHYNKWEVALPAYAWAATVAYSRMHLGVHYPTDVVAGMALGVLVPVVVWKIAERNGNK